MRLLDVFFGILGVLPPTRSGEIKVVDGLGENHDLPDAEADDVTCSELPTGSARLPYKRVVHRKVFKLNAQKSRRTTSGIFSLKGFPFAKFSNTMDNP